MDKKEMSLNFALDLLYQEATNEECKYSQKQKEAAYMVLKDNIYILKILRKYVGPHLIHEISEDYEKEAFREWLNK